MNATADLLPDEPRLVTKLPPSKGLRLIWIIGFGSLVLGRLGLLEPGAGAHGSRARASSAVG